jgi:hypothetical protein
MIPPYSFQQKTLYSLKMVEEDQPRNRPECLFASFRTLKEEIRMPFCSFQSLKETRVECPSAPF